MDWRVFSLVFLREMKRKTFATVFNGPIECQQKNNGVTWKFVALKGEKKSFGGRRRTCGGAAAVGSLVQITMVERTYRRAAELAVVRCSLWNHHRVPLSKTSLCNQNRHCHQCRHTDRQAKMGPELKLSTREGTLYILYVVTFVLTRMPSPFVWIFYHVSIPCFTDGHLPWRIKKHGS